MKKQTAFNLTLVLSAFVSLACTCSQHHIYYSPPVQNVPMLKEKNEINIEFGACGADPPMGASQAVINSFSCDPAYTGGLYFQGAYSPKENIGLTLNFMNASLKQSSYSNSNGNVTDVEGWGSGFSLDAGIGYYATFDKFLKPEKQDKIAKHIILETYGGIGYSAQQHFYRDSAFSGNADLKSFIFYAQPAIGINLRWLTFAVSFRVNNFYYYDIVTDYPANYPGSAYATVETNFLDYLRSNPLQTFIEPAFTIKAGWKYAKLSFQYCNSTVLNTGQPSHLYETQKFSLGFQINIAQRYKKQIKQ